MKKKQTFTEMLNGLIENGLIITSYENINLEEEDAKAHIDIYINESKFHHCELYMIPDDMIKVLEDILITDFISIVKFLHRLSGEDPSEELIQLLIKRLRKILNICRVYDIDSNEVEKLKKATKRLFDDIGARLDNQ